MFISYDSQADAVYIQFDSTAALSTDTREIDMWRYVDYDETGEVIGVEFLRVSHGIDLTGMPEAEQVAAAIRSLPGVAEKLRRTPPAA